MHNTVDLSGGAIPFKVVHLESGKYVPDDMASQYVYVDEGMLRPMPGYALCQFTGVLDPNGTPLFSRTAYLVDIGGGMEEYFVVQRTGAWGFQNRRNGFIPFITMTEGFSPLFSWTEDGRNAVRLMNPN